MYPLKMNHQNFTLEGTLKKYEWEPWDSGNIQHCTVSYNTSCNSDYNLTVQPYSDKYDVFYDLTIQQRTLKIPNLGRIRAKIPNSMGYGPLSQNGENKPWLMRRRKTKILTVYPTIYLPK